MKIELTKEDICYLHDCVDSDIECRERELAEATGQYRTADAVDIEASIQQANDVLAKLDGLLKEGDLPLWKRIIDGLPSEPTHDIWSDGTYILCRTESIANAIADLLDSLYAGMCQNASTVTGYFDPKDDAHSGETDQLTGWWYVDIDG